MSSKTPETVEKKRRKSYHRGKNSSSKHHSKKSKRKSQVTTATEKATLLANLKQEFNEYRAKLLQEWMWKKPRGFDKEKWKRRFRPPSRKAWKDKKRIERVAEQLAYEKATNMFPPAERYVSMEHYVDPDRARFLDLKKLSIELIQHTYLRGLYLTRCVVGDKGLRILCSALKKTQAPLEILDVRSNSITDNGLKRLCTLLKDGGIPTLKTLGLGYNRLTSGGASMLSELLVLGGTGTDTGTAEEEEEEERAYSSADETRSEQFPNRTKSACESKTMDTNDIEKMYESKTSHDDGIDTTTTQHDQKDDQKQACLKFTSLNLYHNDGATPLRRRISLFKGSRGIGRKGIAHIARALKTTNVPLAELNLWSINMGSQGMKLLGEALEVTRCPIRRIGLSRNNARDEGIIALSKSLQKRASSDLFLRRLPLTFLDVSYNVVTDIGFEALATALRAMGPRAVQQQGKQSRRLGRSRMPLQQINVSFNRIGDAGLTSFAMGMRHFSRKHPLREVDFRDNMLTCDGIKDLCWALKLTKARRLTHIYLSNNVNVGDEGGLELANMLTTTNVPITTLELNNIGITNVAASKLADALRESSVPLESMSIRDNKITSHLKGFIKNWVIFRESQVVSDDDDSDKDVNDDVSI
tara:strand:- start:281 stop:2203 length:1923 start_codon:yes stop_codon:yes gene_type:complete